MPNFVPDDGTGNEQLVVIGEAPGRNENRERRPFVGAAGHRLLDWMNPVGLKRTDAYWTNVYPYQPLANKIETVPRATLSPFIDDLHERLARLTDPIVIVPTGNTALRALTNFAYFPWEPKKRGPAKHKITVPGIFNHRGSIYSYTDLSDRVIKVIPTIHPAATFRAPKMEKRCILDWRRIAEDLRFRELRLPKRTYYVPKTMDELHGHKDLLLSKTDAGCWPLVIDAEWLPGGFTLCGASVSHLIGLLPFLRLSSIGAVKPTPTKHGKSSRSYARATSRSAYSMVIATPMCSSASTRSPFVTINGTHWRCTTC